MFKIGDIVRVREGLVLGYESLNSSIITKDMKKFEGKVGIISDCEPHAYCIENFNKPNGMPYYWTEELLEPVVKKYTMYSTNKVNIIKFNNDYIVVTDNKIVDAIHKIQKFIETNVYPKYGTVYYTIIYNYDEFKYDIQTHNWVNSLAEQELFDNKGIFIDKQQAIEVVNTFNTIIQNTKMKG